MILILILSTKLKIMKKVFIFLFCICPIVAYSGYGFMTLLFKPSMDSPKVVVEKKVEETPKQINASVRLTKWQLEKMLSNFYEQDPPSEMRVFNSVVNHSADGWQISSTHLVKNPKHVFLPTKDYHVVDASSIDFSGSFKECVDYADEFKDHHEYIVISVD